MCCTSAESSELSKTTLSHHALRHHGMATSMHPGATDAQFLDSTHIRELLVHSCMMDVHCLLPNISDQTGRCTVLCCMFEFEDVEAPAMDSSPATSVASVAPPVVEVLDEDSDSVADDRPQKHENSKRWWMEKRTWPHWYASSVEWSASMHRHP